MSTKSAVKETTLADFVTKHLADRAKRLDKQPAAIADGGVAAIIKSVCESLSPQNPSLKAVALVTVLGKCGSKANKEDLAVK